MAWWSRLPKTVRKSTKSRKLFFDALEDRTTPTGELGLSMGIGGANSDSVRDVTADAAGNVYIAGTFTGSIDVDPTPGVLNLTSTFPSAFVAKFGPTGSLIWAKQASGSGSAEGLGVRTDPSGNVYVVGNFFNTIDFDPSAGTNSISANGGDDIFIWKFDSAGTYVWTKVISGPSFQEAAAIDVDAAGNIYVTGDSWAATVDFDPGPGTFPLTAFASSEAFALKLDQDGNFIWARITNGSAGSNRTNGRDLVVDSQGNVIVVGEFSSNVDFNFGSVSDIRASTGSYDSFVWKLNADGTNAWVRTMGGSPFYDSASGVEVDSSDNVYTTGDFNGPADYDPTAGVTTLTGINGAFIQRLNADGSFAWARSVGSFTGVVGQDVDLAFGPDNTLFVVGDLFGTNNFASGVGSVTLTSAGGTDVFVERANANTGALLSVLRFGGPGFDRIERATGDAFGNVFLTGRFTGTADMDPNSPVTTLTSNGGDDIFVTRINGDPPLDLALSNDTVPETALVGTTVGTVTTVKGIGGFTYELMSGLGDVDNASFTIDPVTGDLKTNIPLDFETKTTYSIRVRSTDLSRQVAERIFAVKVGNVNETPIALNLSTTNFPENRPVNTVVGTFATIDPDKGQTYTYSFVAGTGSTDNAQFNIAGNALRASASFDFETKSSYSIRVRVTDSGNATFERAFTITILDGGEIPSDIALSNATLPENAGSNIFIGTLTSTDADSTIFTYTLAAGPGASDNGQFLIVGSQLFAKNSLDFESGATRSIRIRTTDPTGLTYDEVFTINVSNVPEAPSSITLSPATIVEKAAPNTKVGNLSAIDPDGTTNFTFALVAGTGDDDNGLFSLTGTEIRALQTFQLVDGVRSIRVRATDGTALFLEKQIFISIANVPESPTTLTLSNNVLAENGPGGQLVGTLRATDPDPNETLRFALVAGTNDNGFFTVNVSNGQLRTAKPLDFEQKSKYTVQVEARDSTNLRIVRTFTISVTNRNDPPVNTLPASRTIYHNEPLIFSTARKSAIRVSDQDAGTRNMRTTISVLGGTFFVGKPEAAAFLIEGNGSSLVVIEGSALQINNVLSGARFAPRPGYLGGARVRITTNDLGGTGPGGWQHDTDTIEIHVVNRPPVINGLPTSFTYNVARSGVLTVATASGLVRGRTDLDGDRVTTRLFSGPANGTVSLRTDGSFVYRPAAGFVGQDAFYFRYFDGITYSPVRLVVINVL